MRLAALYSGGKDSTLAMYLAEQAGHTVEYVVNITPGTDDSMIFHVPNADMVPLLAEAMGRELITAVTGGSEDEDMNALRTALSGLDVEGVVTGAVLSDYQWDRINSVCGDIGLMCMSPLWRKDPDAIMKELTDSGILSVIVGVYAEGLDDSWLGKSVNDSYAELKKAALKNKISVIGEGGEYETLTLDSPMQTHRLEIKKYEKEWNGRSGTLKVTHAELIKKVR